jgi:hypothetical protein
MFMRYIFCLLLSVFFMATGCSISGGGKSNSGETFSSGDSAVIVFDKLEHSFGDIKQGDEVACRFGFKNEGTAPLIIQDVRAGCGCTNIKFPTVPVAPGERGAVEVTFNSRGRNGFQRQNVRVYSNGREHPVQLIITADVQ